MLSITTRTPLYLGAALLLYALNSNALTGKTTRVTVASNGEEANGASETPLISANGRYVVFKSAAFNLIVGDNVSGDGFFIKDLLTNKITHLDIPKNAKNISISGDARYVAYTSFINSYANVFVYDCSTKKSTMVSIKPDGNAEISSGDSFVSISVDGHYVAFNSDNRPVNDIAVIRQVYIYDLLTKKTTLASISSNGKPGNGDGEGVVDISLSADGRFVAFSSNATNLVSGDTNSSRDVFVHDRATRKTTRVSVGKNGKQGNNDSYAPKISADGRFVVFSSDATNLLGAFSDAYGLYLTDRVTNTITKISYLGYNAIAYGMSADGRYVALEFNNKSWVYDRVTQKTNLVTADLNGGEASNDSLSPETPSISADGRYVAFASDVSSLVTDDKNNDRDIFVRDNFLNTSLHADLKISATKKPATLKSNSNGTYVYTISNSGPDTIPIGNLQYAMSGATPISLKTSQGRCVGGGTQRTCNFGKLVVGKKVMLTVVIKAQSKAFNQQMSVNGTPVDATPSNNYLSLSTPVQ